MDWISQIDAGKIVLFTMVLSRVSGLTATAPLLNTPESPMQFRGLLSASLALLITPTQWNVAVPEPGSLVHYLVLVGSELVIGLCLGLGLMILFSGIQLAGELIGRVGGLMLSDIFDPVMGESVPLFSRLLHLAALAAFVLIGGHRMVVAGLLDTFQTIPLGSGAAPFSMADAFLALVTQSFSLGLRAAMPAVTALLLATLVMGLISRTVPQLNIMAVGFGLNALLTFGAVSLSLGAAVWVFQEQIGPALEVLLDGLHAPLRSEWLF
ncbi:MAG: flagellar biosynthetic protein FliR [Pirellulales bacterium]|nr:flagellar biosynthetic protein FliR [Pirellulales bacterium]